MLGALPLSGVFGFVAAYAALLAGVPVLLEPVFRAPGVISDMAELGVTHVVGGDDLIGRIADEQRRAGTRLALRHVLIADFEGRTPELAEWAEDIGSALSGVYGSSETFALTAFWPVDTAPELRTAGGGQVVTPAIEIRIADPLTEQVLPDGEQGELQLRGPNVVDAYLGDPSVMTRSFTADGWFRTGDLAVRTGPDAFRYVCRIGDVLRLRGFLVDPAEIELRLIAHEAVALAKVVGAPARDGHGTEAVAFVVLEPGRTATEDELREWCAATLAKFKVPTEVRFLDEMPTTSGTNGTKIRAAALRELAAVERTPR
jgi:fatty-acyl-CoA synthase